MRILLLEIIPMPNHLNLSACAYADFVVIKAPTETLLRPVTEDGRAFIEAYYAKWERGIGQAIALSPLEAKAALDLIRCAKLRVCKL